MLYVLQVFKSKLELKLYPYRIFYTPCRKLSLVKTIFPAATDCRYLREVRMLFSVFRNVALEKAIFPAGTDSVSLREVSERHF